MSNLKLLYKVSVGIVIAVFLIVMISDVVQNNSKSNYRVIIISSESASSENFKWLYGHRKVWSVGTGTLDELEEKYDLPAESPTYLVTKVKRKLFRRGYYTEVMYVTHDLEELRKFLDQ